MKIILAVLMVVSLAACESVQQINQNSEWAWQAMHVIDVAQTVAGPGHHPECHNEGNFFTKNIIGEHPETDDILQWGLASGIVHWAVWKWIDRTDMSEVNKLGLRLADNAEKVGTIIRNNKAGVRIFGREKSGCDLRGPLHKPGRDITIQIMRF